MHRRIPLLKTTWLCNDTLLQPILSTKTWVLLYQKLLKNFSLMHLLSFVRLLWLFWNCKELTVLLFFWSLEDTLLKKKPWKITWDLEFIGKSRLPIFNLTYIFHMIGGCVEVEVNSRTDFSFLRVLSFKGMTTINWISQVHVYQIFFGLMKLIFLQYRYGLCAVRHAFCYEGFNASIGKSFVIFEKGQPAYKRK